MIYTLPFGRRVGKNVEKRRRYVDERSQKREAILNWIEAVKKIITYRSISTEKWDREIQDSDNRIVLSVFYNLGATSSCIMDNGEFIFNR